MTIAKEKIAITIRPDLLARIRAEVAAGRAASVSGFIEAAVDAELTAGMDLDATLREVLAQTGGPATAAETAWADGVLGGHHVTDPGLVLDTGALIAIDRGQRQVAVLLTRAIERGARLSVPAGCVAQAWRASARQARLASLLRSTQVEVVPLDGADARLVGGLLARTGTTDVVDAHVALVALRRQRPVLTSDPEDIGRLAPSLVVHAI